METEAAENTPRNQDLGGDEEDAEEDEEDDFVDVGRSRFLQTMSLQQVPLGTILRLRLHSGKEHPQWPQPTHHSHKAPTLGQGQALRRPTLETTFPASACSFMKCSSSAEAWMTQ